MSLRFIISAMILATICIIPNTVGESEATQKLAIDLSRSCQASPNCPTYDDLKIYDNSNVVISGKFIKDHYNKTKRECTKIEKSLAWYDTMVKNRTIIFVDPCYKESTYMHRITIVPQLDNYFLSSQMKVKEVGNDIKSFKPTQNNRTVSHTRYVDDNCDHATITAKNWKVVLDDTIRYLLSGCNPDYTKIKTTTNIVQNLTKHDIATSSKWKLEQYYNYVKQKCLSSRNICDTTNNKAVSTMGNER